MYSLPLGLERRETIGVFGVYVNWRSTQFYHNNIMSPEREEQMRRPEHKNTHAAVIMGAAISNHI